MYINLFWRLPWRPRKSGSSIAPDAAAVIRNTLTAAGCLVRRYGVKCRLMFHRKVRHMLYYLTKLLLSAGIIVVVSEVAKVNTGLGALIKSLPLISILAMIWLYTDTRDTANIAELSVSTFWLALPTLPMFLVLSALLRASTQALASRSASCSCVM